MTSDTENQLLRQIRSLSLEELLWLAAIVEARAAELQHEKPRPTWASIAGTLRHDPAVDAQDWVRKLRDDSEREAGLHQ